MAVRPIPAPTSNLPLSVQASFGGEGHSNNSVQETNLCATAALGLHRVGAPLLEWQENLPSLVAPAAAAARYDEVVTLK